MHVRSSEDGVVPAHSHQNDRFELKSQGDSQSTHAGYRKARRPVQMPLEPGKAQRASLRSMRMRMLLPDVNKLNTGCGMWTTHLLRNLAYHLVAVMLIHSDGLLPYREGRM